MESRINMSLTKNKHISKGWHRHEISTLNIYIKAFKRGVIGSCIKFPKQDVWHWVIKDIEGNTKVNGHDVNSKHALQACDAAYKLLKL